MNINNRQITAIAKKACHVLLATTFLVPLVQARIRTNHCDSECNELIRKISGGSPTILMLEVFAMLIIVLYSVVKI